MNNLISVKNDRIKRLRQLTSRRGRRKAGRYLILGRKIVLDSVALNASTAAKNSIVEIYKTASSAALESPNIKVYEVNIPDFSKILGADYSYDVIAIAEYPKGWSDITDLDSLHEKPSALCIPCGVQDPGNLGTILRTSWFLGVNNILLTPGNADPWSPKVQRAAIGALLRLPIRSIDSSQQALEYCQKHDIRPVLLQTRGGQDPVDVQWPKRVAFFLGEEGQGFARQGWDLKSLNTIDVTIQAQSANAESLNVAVAYSIVAHAWSRAAHKSSATSSNG